jgi:integrase
MFKWAVENELVPSSLYHGLQAVAGLKAGRSGASEPQSVKPVSIDFIQTVFPFVSRQVKAMIQIQLLTGMRSGEIVVMRGSDIDTSGPLWIYKP